MSFEHDTADYEEFVTFDLSDIRPFNGVTQYDAREWLEELEFAAFLQNWSDRLKIRALARNLRNDAIVWFRNLPAEKRSSWLELREAFDMKYSHNQPIRSYLLELTSLKQHDGEHVAVVCTELENLLRRRDIILTEHDKVNLLRSAIRESLTRYINWDRCNNLDNAIKEAHRAENLHRTYEKKSLGPVTRCATTLDENSKPWSSRGYSNRDGGSDDHRKGAKDNKSGKSRKKPKDAKDAKGSKRCYVCGDPNHVALNCPRKFVTTS
ncbi:uncharacterized protein VTP21DRAFT_5994 [Calcarisporiella thermophila]|uniref:uncharacterized protein n=1 Tax=Calcarisporiella thermophila TaxID=911321 RepID=UPI003743B258